MGAYPLRFPKCIKENGREKTIKELDGDEGELIYIPGRGYVLPITLREFVRADKLPVKIGDLVRTSLGVREIRGIETWRNGFGRTNQLGLVFREEG
jgi:hypothetical protein